MTPSSLPRYGASTDPRAVHIRVAFFFDESNFIATWKRGAIAATELRYHPPTGSTGHPTPLTGLAVISP